MEIISVIIPAYNAAMYLPESIESALAQTYRQREIIVVDDGSTDDTTKILTAYGAAISVIRQPNTGSASACNTGAMKASGSWIAFLDADDVWLPDKLSHQMDQCGAYSISHTDSICFGEGIPREILRSSFEPPYSGRVLRELLIRNFITKSSVIMRRDVFLKYGGLETRYIGVEDWPFWLKVCADNELGYLPEAALRYRVHRKSKSMDARKTLVDHLRIIDEAFSANGAGAKFPELWPKALASSYSVNSHYAAESGDWTFAVYCALKSLQISPTDICTWKTMVKAMLIPAGIEY